MCWLCFNNELPCYSSTVFWFLRPAQMVTKWTCKWIPINQHVQFKEFVFGWPNHSRNYWGTIFQSLLHLMHHSVLTNILFFPIFYLIAILHFLIVIIMRELKMRIWIYLLHFFFNLLARNPLVWWIHVCGNLDILVFFFLYTYIAASLRWCAFPIKHSKFIWFKGIFSLFLIS